jgi:uncharacterized membrane protein YhaH (DUF805 family)
VRRDPFLVLALSAHIVVTLMALSMIIVAALPSATKIVLGAVLAAILLPGIATLARKRHARLPAVALVLVAVIGAAIVEIVVSGVEIRTAILLGAAMLEFASLITVSRHRAARGPSERAQS